MPANAPDHLIELTEHGLAYCTRCRGGEIELEESCLNRLAAEVVELRAEITRRNEEDYNRMAEKPQ